MFTSSPLSHSILHRPLLGQYCEFVRGHLKAHSPPSNIFGQFSTRKISRSLVRDFLEFVRPSTRRPCPIVLAWRWKLTLYVLKIIAILSASKNSCGRRFESSSSEELSYEHRVKFRNHRQRSRSADRPVKLRNYLDLIWTLLILSSTSISHWGRTYFWSSSSGFHQHLYYFQWFTI